MLSLGWPSLHNVCHDGCFRLTIEALVEQKPVLIFCMTKAVVEQTANLISRYILHCNSKPDSRFPQLRDLSVDDEHLLNISDKLMPFLKTAIAYHHSGICLAVL